MMDLKSLVEITQQILEFLLLELGLLMNLTI